MFARESPVLQGYTFSPSPARGDAKCGGDAFDVDLQNIARLVSTWQYVPLRSLRPHGLIPTLLASHSNAVSFLFLVIHVITRAIICTCLLTVECIVYGKVYHTLYE
jgi:hypothetical protein